MNEMTFVDRVKKHFGYLESDYGFRITFEGKSDVRPQTDGGVRYSSDTIVIIIDSETGYAAVRFYRIQDGENYYLDPVAINEFLYTTDKEKELLLSTNPMDHSDALALFNQKFLLNQPDWKSEGSTTEDKLEVRLSNYANWLKTHAKLCITGDFSRWPEFYEYKIHKARAEHLRRRKDELGYARVKDSEGNWKLIRQSIFKDDLDHVEKLKEEFSR